LPIWYLNFDDMQGYQQSPELVVMAFLSKPSIALEAEIHATQKDIIAMRERVADLSGDLGKIENKFLRFYPHDKMAESSLKEEEREPYLRMQRKMLSEQLDGISKQIKVKEGLIDAYRQALLILPGRLEHIQATRHLPGREVFVAATRRGGSTALARLRGCMPELELTRVLDFLRETGAGEAAGQDEDDVQVLEDRADAVSLLTTPRAAVSPLGVFSARPAASFPAPFP
jgi:hypothetical protein